MLRFFSTIEDIGLANNRNVLEQTKRGALASAPNHNEMADRRVASTRSTEVKLVLDDAGCNEDEQFRFVVGSLGSAEQSA